MDKESLQDNIDIIFNNEIATRKSGRFVKRYSWKSGTGPRSKLVGTPSTVVQDIYGDYKAFPEMLPNIKDIDLYYSNLALLLKLYENIRYSEELTKFFIEYLYRYTDEKYVCYLTIETLTKLGYLDKLIGKIFHFNIPNLKHFFIILDELLFFEYPIFSEEQLKKIKKAVKNAISIKFSTKKELSSNKPIIGIGNRILQRINLIFYSTLSQSLSEGTDFQISIDREKIKEKMSTFGFDSTLLETLDKIEEIYQDSTKDEFDNSMAMGQLRTFLEKSTKLICKKINEKTKESYPKTKPSEMGNLREYMKKHLNLGEENDLLDAVIKIINHKGSHNLISEREYFRVTKNISIETTFLLLTKLEKFIGN